MVMLTEVAKERTLRYRGAQITPVWSLVDGVAGPEGDGGTTRLGVRLSDMLSADSRSYVERQRQPSGE
jgi:hypothetical protein